MTSYFCIVNLPGAPYREIAALSAESDADAKRELEALAANWPGFETIALYEGERPVAVLSNPALGFAAEPLALWDEAA